MSKKSDAKDGIFGDEFTLAKADKDDSQPQQTISKPKKKSSTKDSQQDKQQLTQQQKQQRKRKRQDKASSKSTGTENIKAYKREAPKLNVKAIQDKKMQQKLKRQQAQSRDAAYTAARSEILLPEEQGFLEAEGMEKSYNFKQSDIKEAVDVASARKVFDLKLDTLGPYCARYTPNGRHLLVGGRKGHLASFDWKTGKLGFEIHLNETIRDVTWLHNESLLAVAQRRSVYVYDKQGSEVYVLRKFADPHRLEFLRYHFLLASVGNAGWLKYHDTSVGKLVVEHRTKLGPCRTMAQNPYNAVLHLGHTNGTVTLWTPNMSTYAVKQLCHKGPVQAIAVDSGGHYMATAGLDGQMKVWDIRKFADKPLHEYYTPTPATHLDISQQGLLAVAHGPKVQIWKDAFTTKQKSPYMSHMIAGSQINTCRFAPFEDVLGLGHSNGVSSILVPGSGEANFDAREANPYETTKQRNETEVRSLLEKIPAEMITLNPDEILSVNRSDKNKPLAHRAYAKTDDDDDDDGKTEGSSGKERVRKRGRNSASKRVQRKQKNVVDAKRVEIQEKLEREKARQTRSNQNGGVATVLDRFH